MTQATIEWLRQLANKGAKGIVDNIDARSLGRIADDLAAKEAEIKTLRNIGVIQRDLIVALEGSIQGVIAANSIRRASVVPWEGDEVDAACLAAQRVISRATEVIVDP